MAAGYPFPRGPRRGIDFGVPSPRERHDALLLARREALAVLQRRDGRFADARLAVFVLILGTGFRAGATDTKVKQGILISINGIAAGLRNSG